MDIQRYRADYIVSHFFKNFSFTKITFPFIHSFSSIVLVLIALVVATFIIALLRMIISSILSLRKKLVFLEITPPAFTQKTAYTTQQLFSVLHTIGNQRTICEKLLGKKNLFSFEIISTRKEGIRYIVSTTTDRVQTIEQVLLSYLPQVKVKHIDEYLPLQLRRKPKLIEFRLTKHYAYPLAKQDLLNQHDPVAYITGMMTKLNLGELIALQIVASPIKPKEVVVISQKILHNEYVLRFLDSPRFPWYVQPVIFLVSFFSKLFQAVGWVINDLSLTKEDRLDQRQLVYFNQMTMNHIRPARVLSSFEQEAVTSIQSKMSQPLFEVAIRVFILVNDKKEQTERVRGITAAFSPFVVPGYQSLKRLINFPIISDFIRQVTFRKRQLSLILNKNDSLLSASELADLYHFPYMQVTRTENIVKNLSPDLPAPLTLKQDTGLDVVFGQNTYGNTIVSIGLTDDERSRHMYLIGQTGSGKTTALFHMAKDDIQKGRGLCVVDPHGDLVDDLRHVVPEDRINDVVYINPFDIKYPININLLELTPGLDEDEQELEKELVAESVISIFRRIFFSDENVDAHRIEYILRNTIYTAFYVTDATIFTIYKLLTNPDYHKKILKDVTDENLRDFWTKEFAKAGDWQQFKMVSGVTAKVGRFLYSPIAKRMLEKPTSTIYFDDLLNEGKIILCNLSEGKLGEDTAHLIGTTVITKIHLAILKRARMEKALRKPFYLYVDEFQNFATSSFTRLLSGGRKFGLRVTIAEQSTTQQEDRRIVNVILANVGTVISFRTASPIDEELMLSQFHPLVKKGDILNLPRFHFYVKLGSIEPQEPFSGITLPISITSDKEKIKKIIEASRKNYASVYVKQTFIKTIKKQQKGKSKPAKNTKSDKLKKTKKVKKLTILT